MKKSVFLLALCLISVYLNAQNKFRAKNKKGCVVIYNNNHVLDTIYPLRKDDYQIKIVDNRIFEVDRMSPIPGEFVRYYFINEFGNTNSNTNNGLEVIHHLSICTRGCIAAKEFSSFKIRLLAKHIAWQVRRDGKIIKGKISYNDFSTMKTFKFPEEICGVPSTYDM